MLYSNPEADSLIARTASEMDRVARWIPYFTPQEIVAEETPISPIYHDMTIYAAQQLCNKFQVGH